MHSSAALVLACLACTTKANQDDVSSQQVQGRRPSKKEMPLGMVDCTQGKYTPVDALAALIMALDATNTFIVSTSGVSVQPQRGASSLVGRVSLHQRSSLSHRAGAMSVSMDESTGEDEADTEVERLKLRAERAALEAQKAALEAEMLEAQLQKQNSTTSGEPSEQADAPASIQVPGARWPYAGKSYRFVTKEDDSFKEYARTGDSGFLCKTPTAYSGIREDGYYPGSHRLQFTMPGKGDEPKTLEMLRSRVKAKPSFGAVKLNMPVGADVDWDPSTARLVVVKVEDGSNAERAGILEGDFFRAVSVPYTDDATKEDVPWWQKILPSGKLDSDQGLVFLEGGFSLDYAKALDENEQAIGKQAEVVIVIERGSFIAPKMPWEKDE